MVNLYFQHGWGFDKSCWGNLLSRVKDTQLFLADRGYLGHPSAPFNHGETRFNVVVCHSLGLHLIPEQILNKCRLLLIFSGFKCFHGLNEIDGRFSRRHVKRMLKEIDEEPVLLLKKFYSDCSYLDYDLNGVQIDQKLLKDDLVLLDQQVFAVEKIEKIAKSILIHGADDRVVPIQRAKDIAACLKNSEFVTVKNAGHGLPFTHPQYCWQIIDEAIKAFCDGL